MYFNLAGTEKMMILMILIFYLELGRIASSSHLKITKFIVFKFI